MLDPIVAAFRFMTNLIIGAMILHIASRIVRIEEATFGKALAVSYIAAVLGVILGLFTSFAGIIALVSTTFFIKAVYKATWGKTAIAWLLYLGMGAVIGFMLKAIGLEALISA
jgi:hypothetical protein